MHLAAAGGDVVDDRLAEALGRVAIEERHLGAVALLQEAIQGGEHHGAGDLIGIDEIKRLGHGDEHLIVHPLRNVVDLQPLGPGVFIALLHVTLAPQHRRHQAQSEGNLLRPGEHVVVAQNRGHTVEGRRDLRKVKTAVSAGRLLLIEDHRVALPLQPIFDVQLLEELAHVAVSTEKDVQPGLVPVAVLVLPGGHLAPEHIASLHHHRSVAGIAEVLGSGKTRQSGTGDRDPHSPGNKGGQP